MAAASSRFLGGARGSAVIPTGSGGGGAAGGSITPQISITTGPVLEFEGQRYVTLEDLDRAMRKTADGVFKTLRAPSSRFGLGIA
jgi:uncharacterized spore protein YtfJ